MQDPQLSFSDLSIANVGFDLLRRFAVTIDVERRRVRLEEGQVAAGPSPARRRYGVRIQPSGSGDLEVAGRDPGSPAEKAGLLAGDRIVGVNGKPVGELSPGQIADMMHASPVSLVVERKGER
jgi:C-terminal processing protease CtpA/Prc